MTLEPVAASDFEDLLAIRIEAMRESLERIGRFDPVRARERFRASFSAPHTQAIVLDGERVGFVAVKPQGDHLLLDHLYVRPSAQRRGIGAQVLLGVFARADAEGLAVRVGALRDSDSNPFYVRHGFQRIDEGEFDIYYVRPPMKPAFDPEGFAQRQLDAYNARDLERFVAEYTEDVKAFNLGEDKPLVVGKDAFAARYRDSRFNLPGLHAKLVSRMVIGNKVIDQEYVTGMPGGPLEVAAIYEVTQRGISKVWFVRGT